MLRATRRIAMVMAAAGAMIVLAAAPSFASGDNLTPANTTFHVSNSGNVTFTGTIDGVNVTVTCKDVGGVKAVTMTAKTRASGLTADVTSGPTFSNCTDNLGGTDTITTSGSWTLTNTDAGDPAGEPQASGDQLTINIPASGAVFTSTASGCTVTAKASTPTSSSFDDQTTSTFSNATVNVSVSGFFCFGSNTSKLSGKFVSDTVISDTA